MAGISLDGIQTGSTAERDITEQLRHLQQEAQYRPQPSVQSAPESSSHTFRIQDPERPENNVCQEAMHLSSSSAPTHFPGHLPAIRTSMPVSVTKQEVADSRSTLSEADTFEPGSVPTTAHSSPMTPPCQVQQAVFPSTPPPAPMKQPHLQRVPSAYRETASVLLGDPSAKRSLLPAFDAAAAQAGMPLFELQPFQPLLLDDESAGLWDTAYAGPGRNSWQRRQRGPAHLGNEHLSDWKADSPHHHP